MGLFLGDRACLAAGKVCCLTDRTWAKAVPEVEVRV